MNLENTPLNDKFDILSHLQKSLDIGNYVLTHLKTKNTYQISFINKSNSIIKERDKNLEKLVERVIDIILSQHYTNKDVEFRDIYEAKKTILVQDKIIKALEEKIRDLEDDSHTEEQKENLHRGFLHEEGFLISEATEELLEPLNKILQTYKHKSSNKSKSKHFTEEELMKEVMGFHNNSLDLGDLAQMKIDDLETFKKLRARAYDRLYKRKRKNK